jgi:hypothetical protein
LTLTNAPEFIILDAATAVITMTPTKVSHVGVHTF